VAKAVEAFRNIGEVSAELGVKKHVLRFWEQKFPQLKPMKRGGGRRLYRPGDVELLKGIRDLLTDAGYTIKGVQKILREQGPDHIKRGTVGQPGRAPDDGTRRRAGGVSGGPDKPAFLSGVEMRTLRSITSELEACRALLGEGGHVKGAGARSRRSALRA
jgi:DNA-binding transcriptional MerR regulator